MLIAFCFLLLGRKLELKMQLETGSIHPPPDQTLVSVERRSHLELSFEESRSRGGGGVRHENATSARDRRFAHERAVAPDRTSRCDSASASQNRVTELAREGHFASDVR